MSASVSLESIATQLASLEVGQNAMNGALGLMLDTLRAQTNLLRKLSEYAKDEPAESPVTKIVGELTSAIMDLDASIGSMEKKFDRLSNLIEVTYRVEPAGPIARTNGDGT